MKVLHLWNTAGVASILAKYQAKLYGWRTWVVTRKQNDPFGLTTYGEVWDCPVKTFYVKFFLKSLHYNIIHIHANDNFLRYLDKFKLRSIYKKLIILHYHGSDIRRKWKKKARIWSKADIVLASTPDLYEEAPSKYHNILIFYLPNPVDTELFRPMNLERKERALLMVKYGRRHMWRYIKPLADKISHKLGIRYDVYFVDLKPLSYNKMPLLLNKYRYYMDLQHGFTERESLIQVLSKTGLEALACGCKVVKWNGEVIEGLPEQHRPENVVRRLTEIYKKLES